MIFPFQTNFTEIFLTLSHIASVFSFFYPKNLGPQDGDDRIRILHNSLLYPMLSRQQSQKHDTDITNSDYLNQLNFLAYAFPTLPSLFKVVIYQPYQSHYILSPLSFNLHLVLFPKATICFMLIISPSVVIFVFIQDISSIFPRKSSWKQYSFNFSFCLLITVCPL